MTLDPNLLIFYCPGSRGDFLASILTDRIKQDYTDYTIKYPHLYYYKMHSEKEYVNPCKSTPDEKLRSTRGIRIKLVPDDYRVIAQLVELKQLTMTMTESHVKDWEDQYCKLDDKFKYIVHFANLFDVNFLKQFYQEFNNRPMPADFVSLIEHNIDVQFKRTPLLRTRFQID